MSSSLNARSALAAARTWLRAHRTLAGSLVLLLLAYAIAGFFVVPRVARSQIEAFVTEKLQRRITIGEIRQGIEELRRRSAERAVLLDRWLAGLGQFYEDRLLYVDGDVAEEWGRLQAGRRAPVVDALIAATARVHDLTVVTRSTRDFAKLDVRVLNPFSAG